RFTKVACVSVPSRVLPSSGPENGCARQRLHRSRTPQPDHRNGKALGPRCKCECESDGPGAIRPRLLIARDCPAVNVTEKYRLTTSTQSRSDGVHVCHWEVATEQGWLILSGASVSPAHAQLDSEAAISAYRMRTVLRSGAP